MNIILVSMNHESAPMELREKLELTIQEESMLLSEIYKIPEIRETLYLSTCNQVEVLAHVKDIQAAVESIKDFILSHVNLTPSELERCLYVGCEEVAESWSGKTGQVHKWANWFTIPRPTGGTAHEQKTQT